LLGGIFKSVTLVAKPRYSNLRNARFQIPGGNRFDLSLSYRSFVSLSAKVFITPEM